MNSKDDEHLLNCLAEFEHSEIYIYISTESVRILNNEKFSNDINTVLMTCPGFLSCGTFSW